MSIVLKNIKKGNKNPCWEELKSLHTQLQDYDMNFKISPRNF